MWVTPPKILILYQLKYQLSIIYALFYHNLVVNDEMMTDEPERLGNNNSNTVKSVRPAH